jgi:hypothetical protein
LLVLSFFGFEPKPTFMADPALFNPHAPADLAGEGFERLRRDARPDPIKLTPARFASARAAAEAAACPHRNRGS